MEFKPLYYACLVLCLIIFFEVLINIRKNSLLKVSFLVIIACLFVMNYFSYNDVTERYQVILIKTTRGLYLSAVLLTIIHLVSTKIPRWIVWLSVGAMTALVASRIYLYHAIDLEQQLSNSNQIFSSKGEFYSTQYSMLVFLFALLGTVASITIYYYVRFTRKPLQENKYYRQLSLWIVFIIIPYLLLILYGMLWILNIVRETPATYLFSFFSLTTLLAILFRPKFLNNAQSTLAFVAIQKMVG
ncbi:MAG: hypothetical protein EOO00_06565, partial [Chitinophagaceae bacterium]